MSVAGGGGEAPNDKSRTVVIFGLKIKCDSGEGGGVGFDLIKPNPPPPKHSLFRGRVDETNVCSQLILNIRFVAVIFAFQIACL